RLLLRLLLLLLLRLLLLVVVRRIVLLVEQPLVAALIDARRRIHGAGLLAADAGRLHGRSGRRSADRSGCRSAGRSAGRDERAGGRLAASRDWLPEEGLLVGRHRHLRAARHPALHRAALRPKRV